MNQRKLPSMFYNWMSAAGALVAGVMAAVMASLILIDLFVQKTTLYLGLLIYTVLPVFLILGLMLIVLGAWRERRRLRRDSGAPRRRLIQFELDNPRHRNVVVTAAIVFVLFLLGTSVGTYQAYHVTESTQFCGTLCHQVMEPEFTAHQASPHARVDCVACHIGPGADWFVKSKLSGLYQVYATLADKYPRPIPTPVKNLRPARETCEQCHWPEKFFGARQDVNPHYLADEANTPYPITLLLKIGGGSEKQGQATGIHWHMALANKVEYIARDPERQDIAWVRTTDTQGNTTEYQNTENPLNDADRAGAEVRVMDCIDCHNRPSHIYRAPIHAVNEAMAAGWLDRTLPYIKREAVKALDQEYDDKPAAMAAIEGGIRSFYQENYPALAQERAPAVSAAVSAVQSIYSQNIFPAMKVSWRKYKNNIGHSISTGCFRCHGGVLQTADGKPITSDCNTCHSIMAQGDEQAPAPHGQAGLVFRHPVDIAGAEIEGHCALCHEGGAELY